MAAGDRWGDAHPGEGAARGASGRPALGPGWRPALLNRWPHGLRDGRLGPFGPVDAPGPAPSHRPAASAALGPPPRAARRAGGESGPETAPRWGQRPGRLGDDGAGSAGAGAGDRQNHTACRARRHWDRRQRVAAEGRRGTTLCQGEDGSRQPLTVSHASSNFGVPHSSVRQPLGAPEPTKGRGAATRWRPCTPAMAAGGPEPVCSRQEGLL
jgi:hypothetical protein